MHEHTSEQINSGTTQSSLPPCCGTGCAVCVLDNADEFSRPMVESIPPAPANPVPVKPVAERIQCCNTGCLVCVRDYPELFQLTETDVNTLQLLEAIEQAQQQAAQLHAHLNGETQ